MAKRAQHPRGKRAGRSKTAGPGATSPATAAAARPAGLASLPGQSYIAGIDLFRALAVIFMIFAHTARLRPGLASPHGDWLAAPVSDWLFLAALRYEPLCSAMFLFVAGVSVVLSRAHDLGASGPWLIRTLRRLGVLYLIAVVLSLGDPGFQWPDTIVSPGILSIIAVAVAASALALVSAAPACMLAGLVLAGTLLTAWLESAGKGIPGINAGAGGMFPLVTVAWAGSLCALVHQRFGSSGLQRLLVGALLIGLGALALHQPWITYPATERTVYPGTPLESALAALADAAGLYNGESSVRAVGYWNHSAVFLARTLPLLLGSLMLAIYLWPSAHGRVSRFLTWMGREALNLYVLHLQILAVYQVSGLLPPNGAWGLALVVGIVLLATQVLKVMSLVPFRMGRRTPG
jgi:hypothetical protein